MFRWRRVKDTSLFGRPSAAGLALGALFFALSLSPSLIPRAALVQGALGGLCFSIGYLAGYTLMGLRNWVFEAAPAAPRILRIKLGLALLVALPVVLWALWNVTRWQNDIHAAMGIPPVETARPFTILAVAAALAFMLIFLGRLFRRLWRAIAAQLEAFIPRRLARLIGIGLALMIFWGLGNDVVLGRVLGALDDTYAALDKLIPPDKAPPADALKSGSADSLMGWEGLGAAGRDWVLSVPDAAAITAATGRPAKEPLRIYVGLNSAPDTDARARLALEEALRVGAFERRVLVIATPTGTGWMDPAGMQPLDYLTGGDVAVVAAQYSYLPSWMSLILQPEYGAESAVAVFREIYGHWRDLPEDSRPRLYLFGLSLGARNGELPISWQDLLSDPPQGALWAGPPFAMRGWQQLLTSRAPDSPAWAPRYRDGSAIRVMTQEQQSHDYAPWGVMRMVFLEYPSDPIVFFSTGTLWRAPAWLQGSRGPDVSPSLRWWPVVTFLQLGFDMMTATTTPPGHGHVYAARDYLRAWSEVLDAAPDPALDARLEAIFAQQGL
ncbi:alpha/beta hydrolase [Pseudogemmobacter bohemicus]|uniref:alpha/beta hydrolase n=1 Tax=Pseudogemmobacter bohemicus TaxID=2250708 RepID=UPI000DD49700|nr:alpha/beta-hydrolase family protein [Pseudogemmobacter bohemicus]